MHYHRAADAVIALPARDVCYRAFQTYYHRVRPVVLRRASDLAAWSVEAWRSAIIDDARTGRSEVDLIIRGAEASNALSQRGTASLESALASSTAVERVFDPSDAAHWQWRTTLGVLGSGQPSGDDVLADDPTGSALPACVPLPRVLREWPGVQVTTQ